MFVIQKSNMVNLHSRNSPAILEIARMMKVPRSTLNMLVAMLAQPAAATRSNTFGASVATINATSKYYRLMDRLVNSLTKSF